MSRTELIAKIEGLSADAGLTILRSARFKKYPLKTTLFYIQVALNRYTPLMLPIKAKTIWDHPLYAYETSAIGSIYFLGFYDGDVSLFLLKHFNEQGDLLDVGSNIGYYSSLFTQIASPTAKIVAFEPTPSTYEILTKNTDDLPQVATEKIALSDKIGDTLFYDYGHQHGVFNSSTAQPIAFLRDKGDKIKVETDTLDNWCKRTNTKPSLIKLDTEGTEAGILEQGQEILKKYTPIILLEVGGGEAWRVNTSRCLDILTEHGYDFFELDNTGNPLPHTRQEIYTYKNLVCIPKNKLDTYVPTR